MKQHLCLYLLNSRHTLEDLCTVWAVGLCLTAGMSGADAHSFDAWCSLRQYQHLEIAFALAANVSLYKWSAPVPSLWICCFTTIAHIIRYLSLSYDWPLSPHYGFLISYQFWCLVSEFWMPRLWPWLSSHRRMFVPDPLHCKQCRLWQYLWSSSWVDQASGSLPCPHILDPVFSSLAWLIRTMFTGFLQ